MKILVTGAAGFIGSHVCENLVALGHQVTGIDNLSRGELASLNAIIEHTEFTFLLGDAGNKETLAGIDSDVVIHLASQKIPRYTSGWETLNENGKVSRNILEYCIAQNARLLFASTSDVYGKNPNIPYTETSDCVLGSSHVKRWAYAIAKLHTEHLLFAAGREFGLQFQIMRFFGCYGPRQAQGWWGGPHSVFIEKALLGESLEIHGDGNQTRTFIFIDDLVEGILTLVEKVELENGIFNLCAAASEEIAIRTLAENIWKTIRTDEPQLQFIPYAQFGEYEDVMRRVGSAEKAATLLNWSAQTTFSAGLQATIEWQKSQSRKERV
jgi:UDP-glucose 4-epimerase